MHLQGQIGLLHDKVVGCISITLTYSLGDWSLNTLDYVYPMDFQSKRWKAPLLPTVIHSIGKIVPWSPCLEMNPLLKTFTNWENC